MASHYLLGKRRRESYRQRERGTGVVLRGDEERGGEKARGETG